MRSLDILKYPLYAMFRGFCQCLQQTVRSLYSPFNDTDRLMRLDENAISWLQKASLGVRRETRTIKRTFGYCSQAKKKLAEIWHKT